MTCTTCRNVLELVRVRPLTMSEANAAYVHYLDCESCRKLSDRQFGAKPFTEKDMSALLEFKDDPELASDINKIQEVFNRENPSIGRALDV